MGPHDALRAAIKAAKSQAELGKKIGVGQSTISLWLNGSGKGATAEHVIAIEKVTGVSRHDLRPDLYPRKARPAAVSTEARP